MLSIVFVAGCVTGETGKAFDYEAAQNFKVGASTRTEIVTALGQPVNSGINAEGKFIEYLYNKIKMNQFEMMGAAYGIGTVKPDTDSATCKYVFDDAEVLKDFSCSGGGY